MSDWKKAKGDESFVYELNEQGSNRWFFQVQPGFESDGTRTSEEELAKVARMARASRVLYEALEVLVDSLDDEYVASGLGESEPAKLALDHEVGIALKAMAKARGEHND